MSLLLTLLLGHLIADFSLQSNWVHRLKSRSWIGIVLHVGIHIAMTAALLRQPLQAWPLLGLLGLSHFALDWIKVRDTNPNRTLIFLLDQTGHIITVIGLAWWMPAVEGILPISFLQPLLLAALIPPFIFFIELIFDEYIAEKNLPVNHSDKIPTDITGRSQYELFAYSRYTTILLILFISASLMLACLLPPPLTMKATAQVLNGTATVTASASPSDPTAPLNTIREIATGEVILLAPGDSLETHDQTRVLITYFDGDTAELLPQSQITIQSATPHEMDNRFELTLWFGRTISHIRKVFNPNSQISMAIPSARAIAPID